MELVCTHEGNNVLSMQLPTPLILSVFLLYYAWSFFLFFNSELVFYTSFYALFFMSEIKLGMYRHFKGKFYRVYGLARHSESGERFVVYEPLYDASEYGSEKFCVRPVKMFFEEVDRDGYKGPRFVFVGS